MSLQYYLNFSWIGLSALSPLSALLIACTLVSIHKNRLKSVLILAVLYALLLFQLISFTYSVLTLLNFDEQYLIYISYIFKSLVFFKSLTVLSVQLEEYYKCQSPSNYILNVNSNWLKYHLLVLAMLSFMGTYFFRYVLFLPILNVDDIEIIVTYLSIHAIVIVLSFLFLALQYCLIVKRKKLDVNIIINGCNGGETNSTSSSAANLFGISCEGQQRVSTASILATVNLLINMALILVSSLTPFLPYSLQPPQNLPLLLNLLLWCSVTEGLLTSVTYWLSTSSGRRRRRLNNSPPDSASRYPKKHNLTHAMMSKNLKQFGYSNHGEFVYFGAGSGETVLNNATASSSVYNTFDESFHQNRSYQDSLKYGSVTTIANDDFEYHSSCEYGRNMTSFARQLQPPMLPPLPLPPATAQYQPAVQNAGSSTTGLANAISDTTQNNNATMIIRRTGTTENPRQIQCTGYTILNNPTASLSMNDLDLIEDSHLEDNDNSYASLSKRSLSRRRRLRRRRSCTKYNKNKNYSKLKRRFTNTGSSKSGFKRRYRSLESLHSPNVNETQVAFLDTGESVIIFTTEFL